MKGPFLILVLLLLSVFGAAIDSHAATLTVTKIEDTNDGVCDADCSLREAVAVAIPNDTILFSELFNTQQMITLVNGVIMINKTLTITGTGSGVVNISGNNTDRVFWVSGAVTVTMSELTIRDGHVGESDPKDAFGGGIVVVGAGNTLDLRNLEMVNNFALNAQNQVGNGGGIFFYNQGTAILDNVYMHNNTSLRGGGIGGGTSTSVTVTNSQVIDNTGTGVWGGTVNISNTELRGNTGFGVLGRNTTITDMHYKS
jgi:CSLREA domain-containing protein